MYSFVCRIMAIVFLANCLVPNYGWGQSVRRTTNKSLDTQVERQVVRAQQDNSPAAQFAQADRQVRQAHNEHFAQADSTFNEQAQAQRRAAFEQSLHAVPAVPQDATYVAPLPNSRQVSPGPAALVTQSFLQKIANNELQFKDLIEYADPMNPDLADNNLTTIAYAAEMLGNSIAEAAKLDPSLYDTHELQTLLPQIEARLLYRLALLGHESPSFSLNKTLDPVSVSRTQLQTVYQDSIAKTEAVGSLRIALLKAHRFYQQKNLPDPADEYQKQMLAKQMQTDVPVPAPLWAERPSTLRVDKKMNVEQTLQEARQSVSKYGNMAAFQKNFLDELKQLKSQDPEEGSAEFQQLQILADYAVAYSVEHDPAALRDIVALFDEGVDRSFRGKVKNGDFQQKYSPILNAVFVSIFENTRYASMGEAKTRQVVSLLEEFSDPEKYSLPTRVFALETAGLLYRPFNEDAIQNAVKPPFAFFAPLNLNKPDENLRRTFALRTSELYCPLVAADQSVMQTYGLDVQQMQKLADKLAYIYDGFYDIHTPLFEDPAQAGRVRGNFPATCPIVMHNQPNRLKAQQETTAAVLTFTAESLFWIYGGELFSLLGTAFRLTRGAVAALPKAGKAYKLAANGEKIAAFNAEVRNGAKFANWVYKNKKQQGYIVEVAVKDKSTALVPKSQRGAQAAVEPKYVRVDHTYQLENKYSHWNPKRWLGLGREQEIVGMRVTRLQPNFNVTVAQANFANGEFANGLHSMQDIEKAWSQLRLVTDLAKPMLYETKPYFSAILDLRQAQMEQSLLQGLEKSFDKSMDMWAPISNLPPTKKFKFGIDVLFDGERAWTAEEIAAHTKWWNMTRWGNPYQSARTDMKVFVSARSNAIPNTPVAGGIDLPANLPGFTTTLERMATGQWRQDAFKAFFKPMNWAVTPTSSKLLTNYGKWGRRLRQAGRTFNRIVLPDYLPTPLFWQVAKTSPVFAAKMFPQLIWRQRFVGSSIGLGIWEGSDYLLYPPYLQWLKTEAAQDTQNETNKYGETFSKQRARSNEQLMKELKIYAFDNPSLSTYQEVIQAQKDQQEGTLLTAPIIFARRATNDIPVLGEVTGIEFISDANKALYEHQAHRADLNHARLKQMHTAFAQSKNADEKAKAQFKADVNAAYDMLLTKYPRGFAALPQTQKQLRALFDKYIQDSLAAKTEQERKQLDAQILQKRDQILLKVDTWDIVLETYENKMQELRTQYAQDADLITPVIKQQLKTIYETYADTYVRTVLPLTDPLQQSTKRYLLQNELWAAVGNIQTQLEDQWSIRHPEEAFAKMSDLYAKGFAVLPQYKEPLKALFTQYAADMRIAKTEQAQNQVRQRFHEQQNQLLFPVSTWDGAWKNAETAINRAKEGYGQDADLITPEVEQKVHQIYKEYAQESIQALDIQDQAQQRAENFRLRNKRNKALGNVWTALQKQWFARHPEFNLMLQKESAPAPEEEKPSEAHEPEYGSQWKNDTEEE